MCLLCLLQKCAECVRDGVPDTTVTSFSLEICLTLTPWSCCSVTRSPQFDAWIDMYGGEGFEKEVKDYIGMCDAAAKTADEATLKEMEKHFIMSCKLEHMFWDQAQQRMQWPDIVKSQSEELPN